ncbi:hypothetical protein MMC27_001448 [Xylographa pallens]|nr:hypothetical protein [Xylographa pallens]
MTKNMTWNANADAKLLLAVVDQLPVSLDFESIAGRLGCTPRAVQERIKRLKKLSAGQVGLAQATSSKRKNTAEQTTITKKQKTTTATPTKSPQIKTTPTKEEKEEVIETDKESSLGDSALTSIHEEDEGEDEPADNEDDLGKNDLLDIQSPKHTNSNDLRSKSSLDVLPTSTVLLHELQRDNSETIL